MPTNLLGFASGCWVTKTNDWTYIHFAICGNDYNLSGQILTTSEKLTWKISYSYLSQLSYICSVWCTHLPCRLALRTSSCGTRLSQDKAPGQTNAQWDTHFASAFFSMTHRIGPQTSMTALVLMCCSHSRFVDDFDETAKYTFANRISKTDPRLVMTRRRQPSCHVDQHYYLHQQ